MKTFPRVLLLLFLLLLVAIVCPGGSEVGAARENGPGKNQSVIPTSLPQLSAEILSFTATPATVLRGQTAVLNWRVANADHIWISEVERIDAGVCIKQATGEMQVTPVADTTYRLHAWRWDTAVVAFQLATVRVREAAGFCRISGTILRDRREYATTVNLYSGDSKTALRSTRVDVNGNYQFSGVLEGTYQVVPRGRYPVDRFSIGPNPRSQPVSCQPNGSHRADFTIKSNEG
jgi:hypothetical protein